MKKTNHLKYEKLRQEYAFLRYESFDISSTAAGITVVYQFNLADRYLFRPEFHIPRSKFSTTENLTDGQIDNLVFHIGMAELISYWKAACPQEVIIQTHHLTPAQIAFWKKLYFHGLGEFFYLNGIEPDPDTFMNIYSTGNRKIEKHAYHTRTRCLVPIGGGKDSAVSLDILLQNKQASIPFILNPRGASMGTVIAAGLSKEDIQIAERKIHPQLLALNEKGFLNGHTPFSAVLAFFTLLAAALTASRNIALSNESSANEATVRNTKINHQYSKSLEFEQDFRNYVHDNISSNIHYFSFLRPLSELQIGALFAKRKQYHAVFRSCNAGSKTDSWCGKCPKCLFTYIILSPFLTHQQRTAIFGKDLFNDPDMIPLLRQLAGIDAVKPFECVGTVDEVIQAMNQALKQNTQHTLPAVLAWYSTTNLPLEHKPEAFRKTLSDYHSEHNLPEGYSAFLKSALHDI